jgi:class 3 adenylate cyclase
MLTRKKSFLVVFIFLFWLGYSLIAVISFVASLQELYQQERNKRIDRINYQIELAMNSMIHQHFATLKQNLSRAVELYQVDFAILEIPGEDPVVVARAGSEIYPGTDLPLTEGVVDRGSATYRKVKVRDSTLLIGMDHRITFFLYTYLKYYFWKIVFDIFLVTGVSGALIYFVLRDLIKLTRALAKGDVQSVKSISTQSLEAQILSSATQSFSDLTKELAWESQVFSNSLGSAITTELRKGTPTPQAFEVVLVRVDLNQYTQKFLATDISKMVETINQYFAGAREIIERHSGLIYEYVGDEIIFFFKVKTSFDETFKNAVFCVRDIFKQIEMLAVKDFTVKASIATGTLNFVKLDQGYAFTGVPLITSARLLNFVTDKTRSQLIFEEKHLSLVKHTAADMQVISTQLKGFAQDVKLVEISGFQTLDEVDPKTFCADPDLLRAFDALIECIRQKNEPRFDRILKSLREVNIQTSNVELSHKMTWVLQLVNRPESDEKRLSSILSLIPLYVTKEDYESSVKEQLIQIENTRSSRTRANALMARSSFEFEIKIDFNAARNVSNRYLADALFVIGRTAVDKKITKQIEWMLDQEDRLFRASALYLCSALLKYHHEKDPVYFGSNPQFSILKEHLKKSLNQSDEDLKKHARAFESTTGLSLNEKAL